MQCGNDRALQASALRDRRVALSVVTVRCCDCLPALTDCGRFVVGDSKLRLDCFDHLPPALLVIEVSSVVTLAPITDAAERVSGGLPRNRSLLEEEHEPA